MGVVGYRKGNEYIEHEDYYEIVINHKENIIIDKDQKDKVDQCTWRPDKRRDICYGRTSINDVTKRIHQLIFPTGPGKEVDHIDGNGLNNKNTKLRECTRAENQMNRSKQVSCSSIYKGIYLAKRENKWHVRIKTNGTCISLGYFINEKEAAQAYDIKAYELFKDFAKYNNPYEIENYIEYLKNINDNIIDQN